MGKFLVFLSFWALLNGGLAARFQNPTPEPKYPHALRFLLEPSDVEIKSLEDDDGNAWERSGLFEGDIATSPSDLRNVLRDPARRWTMPIPVYINASDFDDSQLAIIERGISEIEQKTCVRFRQFMTGDSSFIVVRGNDKGCWSSVGRRDGGQIVHLQRSGCMHQGIVVHEFLHALGLHHQQSASDRDDFVRINWKNIEKGRENNFKKYSENIVSNLNLTYDYNSVMHYSSKAFSANGKETITPTEPSAKIGQRKGMSPIDAAKLQVMYDCPGGPARPDRETETGSSSGGWGGFWNKVVQAIQA